MKGALIVGLICVNLVLVAVLVFGATAPKAQAQVRGGGSDYTMVTGHVGSDWDAVYIVDLKTRRMGGWLFNKTTKRLDLYAGRDLNRDFRPSR